MSILEDFLARSDVDTPINRRDITKPENVRWLIRNLWVRNSDKTGFEAASTELKRLYIENSHSRLPMGHPCRQTEQLTLDWNNLSKA